MFDTLVISPEKGRADALGGGGGFGHRPYLCCVCLNASSLISPVVLSSNPTPALIYEMLRDNKALFCLPLNGGRCFFQWEMYVLFILAKIILLVC